MKLLFHHLPKTAGTSLIAQLRWRFWPSCEGARYDYELSEKKIRSRLFRFYHGHFTGAKVQQFTELVPNGVVITFLRNPLNRVISHYHNRVDKTRILKELARTESRGGVSAEKARAKREIYESDIFGMSFLDYLESEIPICRDSYKNRQTRYLTDIETFRQSHEEGLAIAKERLQSLCLDFGLTEFMAESLRSFEASLRLKPGTLDPNYRRNVFSGGSASGNRTAKRYTVTQKELDLLVDRNRLDIDLYAFAVRLFCEKHGCSPELLAIDDPVELVLQSGPSVE
ncbi:MAG: sulfotransferase family 2 domain-containing protein [Verrucomicrobia bacterium]|jgi:hypothetical protein|nr:sulfotransferase family 2 domain-containing protein [Verrucomicrobiota bacterium]